jgi:serine/threonine protein phosphatase PrpC
MKFSVFQVSRKGGREVNEDRMGYCYTRSAGIFFLTDGMGGHPQGEVAAQLALQVMAAMFQKEAKPALSDVALFLTTAVTAAHRQIVRYAIERNMLDAPRTTVVAAVIQDGMVTWIHCGDSRLYLVRQGELLTRTRDHSFAEQRQIGTGKLNFPARNNRNILFTCLGSPSRPMFEVSGPLALQQGDRLMLCSDGLWSGLSDIDITYHLSHKPVSEAVPDLVEGALCRAGDSSDNVTVLALEWETPDSSLSNRTSVSTDTLSEGIFASTVQGGWNHPAHDDLDDAAIDRSIAEINAAIRRSAGRQV